MRMAGREKPPNNDRYVAMDVLTTIWPPLLATLQVLVAAAASAHAVLHKRDVRAAIGWIGLVWLVPFGGSILYAIFGVNRIRRRASGLRAHRASPRIAGQVAITSPDQDGAALTLPAGHLSPVARLMDRMTHVPIKGGNAIEPLVGGETAYRAMLRAIAEARHSLALSTYIFDNDRTGRLFVDALAAAAGRAVAVRVLVDGVGAYYSRPTILAELRRRGVTAAEFLPSLLPLSMHYANLRNHRKLLISDGRIGFTGGMNIRHAHCEADTPEAIADVHFRFEGPVVGQLSETFADDWAFASGETLFGDDWFPLPAMPGRVFARGVPAGPDEAFERIRWAILGALSQARQHIRIVTPYFLPDMSLATALQLAALRGVEIDIVIPARSNLRLVQWASMAKIFHLLARGCRVWLTPAPFDHAKLMTVDGIWSLVGSANWDQRSLRLNFEFNVECYDPGFADVLDALIDARIARAKPLSLSHVQDRALTLKLRDSLAWLLSPYL